MPTLRGHELSGICTVDQCDEEKRALYEDRFCATGQQRDLCVLEVLAAAFVQDNDLHLATGHYNWSCWSGKQKRGTAEEQIN